MNGSPTSTLGRFTGPSAIKQDNILQRTPSTARRMARLIRNRLETLDTEGLELVAYTHRVEKVLREQLVANPTLQRLRDRQPVSEPELEALAKLVLQIDDKANVKHLIGYQPEPRRSLAAVFRGLVGLDEVAVEDILRFESELHDYLARNTKVLDTLRDTNVLDDDTTAALDAAIDKFKLEFQTGDGRSLISVGTEVFEEIAEEDIEQEKIVKQKRGK